MSARLIMVPHPQILRGRRLAAAAIAGTLAALLAGCGHDPVNPYEVTGTVPEDYRTNHPILIEEQIATIDIPVSANTARLSDEARENVVFFAQGFVRSGVNVIAVVAPSGSPNQVAAAAVAVEIENVLRQTGVVAEAIDYRVYQASAEERIAPVRLAYNRIAAHTAPCRPWSDQMTVTAQNRHYGNYGCASQQNLAAMVTNPLDLLYPRGLTPADAARRSMVLDLYRAGQPTASSTTGMSGGTIAGVGE
jgi:pilus assembly protein CpaD